MLELIASNPVIRAVVLIVLFAIVATFVLVGLTVASRRASVRGELKSIAGNEVMVTHESLTARRDDAWSKLANRIEQVGLRLADAKVDVLRDKLRAAGFESPAAPRLYNLIRLLLVILLPSLFVLVAVSGGGELSFGRLYFFGSLAALFGLYVPALFVRAKADRRREAMVNGFPDCLDLMLVCVEAGLGLEAAMDRVGREMTLTRPLVAKLLTTATLRMRAGATREEAMRRMADDASVSEIRSFATLLIQSDKLGTSISSTLRVYASEMRERRRMRAEEKAHRLPVLISIPLVTCMLPTIIGVLMLPAAIQVIRTLVPAMSGG